MYCRYFVTKNSSIIQEISKGDLSVFPVKNSLVFVNDVLKFQKNIIKNFQPESKKIFYGSIDEKERYKQKYPKAIGINKKDYPYFLFSRIPSKKEIIKYCKEDRICNFLLHTNENKHNIYKVLAYVELCGESFQEMLIKRSLWACYLCITNTNNKYIKVENINYSLGSLNNLRIKYDLLKNEDSKKILLPRMEISPKQSVLIPILTLLAPWGGDDIEEFSSIEQELDIEQIQIMLHGKLSEMKNMKNFFILGPGIIPDSINLIKENINILQAIHQFDFSNMYLLDRDWMCGCCPHIFFVTGKEVKYYSEVFNIAQNMFQSFRIVTPKNVGTFIICELEHETTFISRIKINGKTILSNRKIIKDEQIEFKICGGDIIEGSGYYYSNSPNIKILSPLQKNRIIKSYISKIQNYYLK